MTEADDRAIARLIRAVGKDARQHIRRLSPDARDIGWACLVAGIVGAAIHDSEDPTKIIEMLGATLQTTPALRAHRGG